MSKKNWNKTYLDQKKEILDFLVEEGVRIPQSAETLFLLDIAANLFVIRQQLAQVLDDRKEEV